MSRVQQLDDRLLPVAAAALRRLVDRKGRLSVAARAGVTARAGVAARAGVTGRPGVAGRRDPAAWRLRLQALDKRYTARGPLALVREVPQVGLLVAVSVFVVGALVVVDQTSPSREAGSATQRGQSSPGGPAGLPVGEALLTAVGPSIGQLAETYVSDVRRSTQRLTAQSPDSIQLGLVALTGYLTPAQIVTLVGPLQVERVLLRPPVTTGTSEVMDSPVTHVVADLTALFARTAARKAGDAKDLLSTGNSITPTTQEERDFKAFYSAAYATAEQEIAVYRAGCPCVFMLLVRGWARELQALEASVSVRAVQFAPAGLTTGQLVVTPLLPGATGPVAVSPRTNATGS